MTLTSDLIFRIIISPILFELGIPNSVCGCILGWQSVIYQFWGHCDLDLFSRIIMSGAYLIYYLRNPKFGVLMHLWMLICHIPFYGHCDLDL